MEIKLTAEQQRVIGCLLEKQITTPDQYPLSLNSLMLACNQKSNREPVYRWSEPNVQVIIDQLTAKGLVTVPGGYSSRVTKYQHRFCNTEFGELQLNPQQLAIMDVLFLRGAQTPGELRTRTQRLCEFKNVQETEQVLHAMAEKDKPLVMQLAREPGKRESRWMHLLGDEKSTATMQAATATTSATPSGHAVSSSSEIESDLAQRVEKLEQEVSELKQMLEELLQ